MTLTDDKLKEIIEKNKLLPSDVLAEISVTAQKYNLSLQEALFQKDPTYDEKIGEILAKELKVPFVDLSKLTIPEDVFYTIPESFARKQKAVVFSRDKKEIKMAMSNPANNTATDMVTWKTGQKVTPYLATNQSIQNSLNNYRRDLQKSVDRLLEEEERRSRGVYQKEVPEDAPVIRIVDSMIRDAFQARASDIHLEPEENESLARFRIDGILHDVLHIHKILHDRLVTRIKVLSNLRTDEHLSAQDGKMSMAIGEQIIDIRVSIIPIVNGEKVVLRLLASQSREFTLTSLGMNKTDLAKLTSAFEKSYGMILSTGPTGSGKTTTIYSILDILNKRERNITTIEDPVEYRIAGANQVQVNAKTNLTFANGLRSILRQDPNIIFVGEIRDNDTASIAVNAALTGHLVFSTLHTNDAATAIPRLTDMKVEPFLVASTVNVIVAQRLIRKTCSLCQVPVKISWEELTKNFPNEGVLKEYFTTNQSKEITLFQGKGCKACHLSGYLGRIGIFEILEVTKRIRRLITEKADSDAITKAAVEEGMTTMFIDGVQKAVRGLTSIEEVFRAVKTESS
ncbi:MAG: GspE/PulE family protein [Patescibacteria group bacterium]